MLTYDSESAKKKTSSRITFFPLLMERKEPKIQGQKELTRNPVTFLAS